MMTGIKKRDLKLSSVEIKPIDISEDVEAIQLSKNIRVNKSILHAIVSHAGESSEEYHISGMDIIGNVLTQILLQQKYITIYMYRPFWLFSIMCSNMKILWPLLKQMKTVYCSPVMMTILKNLFWVIQ